MRLPFFLAKRFVAGETFADAVPKAKELNSKGLKLTLDLLGENIKDRKTTDKTTQAYCDLLDGIREQELDASISIKLTMLGLDIDKEYCRDNLDKLLEKAKERDLFVRIDMEGSDYTQMTFDLYYDALEKWGKKVGIVIQAYLHRTRDDIDELIERQANVRICKGAYKEPSNIALQNMADIRTAFKEYTTRLIEAANYPRIATHDGILIEWIRSHVRENNVPKQRFEFQMLYGLRQNTCEFLAQKGYPVRIYMPFGTEWLPYYSRRLRERKENVWFILTTMFKK